MYYVKIKQVLKLKRNVTDFSKTERAVLEKQRTQGLERVSIRNRAYPAVTLESPEGSLLK